jgi:hypothetical protein
MPPDSKRLLPRTLANAREPLAAVEDFLRIQDSSLMDAIYGGALRALAN